MVYTSCSLQQTCFYEFYLGVLFRVFHDSCFDSVSSVSPVIPGFHNCNYPRAKKVIAKYQATKAASQLFINDQKNNSAFGYFWFQSNDNNSKIIS